MPPRRPATQTNRRRAAKPKRGRVSTPAALVFIAGVAASLIILFFVYAFYMLPAKQEASKPAPAKPTQTEKAAAVAQQPDPAPAPPATPGQPRLVIVIDDLGQSLEPARDLLDLALPVTFSILPNLPATTETDELAAKAGMEVILHQPMEAATQPREERGTLKPSMSVPEVAATLAAHLAQLPHAAGVSNHTGSKATEDPVLMAAVMTALKDRKLFFLDSLTTSKSAAQAQAGRLNVPFLARNVFLDAERGQQAALLQLAQAEKEAKAKGRAIAIGHPYPETIAALSTWSIRRDKSVKLVTLGSLLKAN
ncbi:hypothetical protein NNJEOMEG_01016 [Fundidesulfovibrio magnetotacticus]|uniref:Divergent polysaccharide deacetylase family protein n=1 Tax=Fundidesulfovibrio magnetotacticus TaxID=2730080 RepID=A0A6V8LY39_9BACT|nr:divergent polysaccharide deacetylase family protein [Fundidesulfovibrio magnetotacticus]GFK93185.1 hypothetical protein NNJEOMEG_01016 [Fundidesulfovibrio magnetotacticus]